MAVERFEEWREEVVRLGDIVQDHDSSIPAQQAEARFNRYVELVGMVEGTEGPPVVAALISSMRAAHDYGAYQATHGALALFSPADFVRGVAMAIPELVAIPADHAGEVLMPVAASSEEHLREFTAALESSSPSLRERFGQLVASQEEDGWLSDSDLRGRLSL